MTAATDPDLVIVRATGLTIDLSASTEELLNSHDDLTEAINEMRSAKQAISNVVAHRLDKRNRRQDEIGRWKVKVNPPTERVWDAEGLRQRLYALSADGLIDQEVIDEVCPVVLEYKVAYHEAQKLRKSPEERVVEAIEESERFDPASRYLKLTLLAGDE